MKTQAEEDMRQEKAAVERLRDAIATIKADLRWYWRWGDGAGGAVLSDLAEAVRSAGYVWPFDDHLPSEEPRSYRKAPISRALSKQVMERDAYRCVVCSSHVDLTCDHIVPESKSGPTTLENLQTMCRSCNSRKGAR